MREGLVEKTVAGLCKGDVLFPTNRVVLRVVRAQGGKCLVTIRRGSKQTTAMWGAGTRVAVYAGELMPL